MERGKKFRGKREDNGEWAYGCLIISDDKQFIVSRVTYIAKEELDFADRYMEIFSFEVIPETVGQYTGLKDKNGVEIFEGDIVKQSKRNYKVYFIDGFYEPFYPEVGLDNKNVKIIGNIYDNKELLE